MTSKCAPDHFVFEELEKRILFSADIGVLAPALPGTEIAAQDLPQVQAPVLPAQLASASSGSSNDQQAQPRHEIVFIDGAIDNAQQLAAELLARPDSSRTLEVLVLDPARDGVAQISDYLATRQELSAVHIISHGGDGELQLGSTNLNSANLLGNAVAVSGWGAALVNGGDILLYGCDVAQTDTGQRFVDALAGLTGADIAASNDLTGSAAMQGNWTLEYAHGQIETQLAPDAVMQSGYAGVLSVFTVSSTADSGAGSLRQAIIDANAQGGSNRIEFSLASGTITLATLLPQIDSRLIIDGRSAGGFVDAPVVEIDGNNLSGAGLTFVNGSANSQVLGLSIVNFRGDGIRMAPGADYMVIEGNYLGIRADGLTAGGNDNGIWVGSINDMIGGTTAAARNVVSGNLINGISVNTGASNIAIQGNYAGTDATGTIAVGNTLNGIFVDGGTFITIGGLAAGAGNLASGNADVGIWITGSSSDINVQGNIAGLDVTGTTAIGNVRAGIAGFNITNLVIGGTMAAARNIASGNAWDGIHLEGNALVQGNYIGTDKTGMLSIANQKDGISLLGGQATIGGSVAGSGNVISGNIRSAIYFDSSSNNTVRGNLIGVAADGISALGNQYTGILIVNSSGNNLIESNTVAHTQGTGIRVSTTGGNGNTFRANTIFSNTALGIDLGDLGVTANDAGDGDTGSNNKQNFPILTSAVRTGSDITISGTINTTANSAFRIDFFANPGNSASGYGEGRVYLGFGYLNTDAAGNSNFITSFNVTINDGDWISATATNTSNGDTSEFAQTIQSVTRYSAPSGAAHTITMLEDQPYVFAAVDFGFSDPNDTPANNFIAVVIDTLPPDGALLLNGSVVVGGNVIAKTDIDAGRLVYAPTANANGSGIGNFSFRVRDDGGTANGSANTDATSRLMTINVTAVNDAPQGTPFTLNMAPGESHTFVYTEFGLTDPYDSPANGWYAVNVSVDPAFGAFSSANGDVVFTLSPSATGSVYFEFQVVDNGGTANGGIDKDPTPRRVTINVVAPTYQPPVLTPSAGSAGFKPGGGAVAIDAGILITDPDSATLASASVQIASNFNAAQDTLAFVAGGATGNISASYNAATGLLSLSSAGATATTAQWQAALRAVTYNNSAPAPSNATRLLTINVNDGTTSAMANRSLQINSLVAGDIAVLGFDTMYYGDIDGDGAGDGSWALLVLTTLKAGMVINITDAGINATQDGFISNPGSDSHLTWTLTSDVAAGTILSMDTSSGINFADLNGAVAGKGGLSDYGTLSGRLGGTHPGNNPVPLAGDQLIIYQGNAGQVSGSTFIYAFTNSRDAANAGTGAWQNSGAATGESQSYMPPGLTAGYTAVALTTNTNLASGTGVANEGSANYAFRKMRYAGVLTDGTREQLLVALADPTRWEGGSADGYKFTVGPGKTYEANFVVRPAVLTTSAGTTSYTEQGIWTRIDDGLQLVTGDGEVIASATISIATHFTPYVDFLIVTLDPATMGNISESFDHSTGIMTLSSAGNSATAAQWQVALRAVGYGNNSDNPDLADRSIVFSATTAKAYTASATRTVHIVGVNDAPVLGNTPSGKTYVEGSPGIVIDPTIVVNDVDNLRLSSASITLYGYVDDILSFSNTGASAMGNISAIFDVGNGVLQMSSAGGTATLAQWQEALRAVTFSNSSQTPSTSARTVVFRVNDGAADSNTVTQTISLTLVNDAPTISLPAASPTYTEGAPGIVIAPGILVSDPDSATLAGASVTIYGFVRGQDLLSYTNTGAGVMGDISAFFDSVYGVLWMTSASGTATVAQWQEALRSVTYSNTSQAPDTSLRSIQFLVNDGAANSNSPRQDVVVIAVNDAPAIVMSAGTTGYTEQSSAVTIDAGLTVSDPDSATLVSGSVRIVTNRDAQDVLGFTADPATMGNISGSYDAATGLLSLVSAGGSASVAQWQQALRSITFSNGSANPGTGNRILLYTLDDGSDAGNASRTIVFTAVNDAPVLTVSPGSALYVENGAKAVIDPGLTVADVDNATLFEAQMEITSNLANGDRFEFVNDGVSMGNIIRVNGIGPGERVNLVSVGATATLAQWQAALRSVTFYSLSENPSTAERTVSIRLGDGSSYSQILTRIVEVRAVNDAPAGSGRTIDIIETLPHTFAASDFGFSDPVDGGANSLLAVVITTLPATGALFNNGILLNAGDVVSKTDIDAGRLEYRYLLAQPGTGLTADASAFVGVARFSFQVRDDGGTADGGIDTDPTPRTMTLSVSQVNHAPVGKDHTVTMLENQAYTFGMADFGFSDPGNVQADTLMRVIISSLPSGGTLTFKGATFTAGNYISLVDIVGGVLVYNPASNANGPAADRFTFRVVDNGGTANGGADTDVTARLMTIAITSVNNAPAGAAHTVEMRDDRPHVFQAGDFGFSDASDTPANNFSELILTTVPRAGSLTLDGVVLKAGALVARSDIDAGRLIFTPVAYSTGKVVLEFSFQVRDDGGLLYGGFDTDATPRVMTLAIASSLMANATTVLLPAAPSLTTVSTVQNQAGADGSGDSTATRAASSAAASAAAAAAASGTGINPDKRIDIPVSAGSRQLAIELDAGIIRANIVRFLTDSTDNRTTPVVADLPRSTTAPEAGSAFKAELVVQAPVDRRNALLTLQKNTTSSGDSALGAILPATHSSEDSAREYSAIRSTAHRIESAIAVSALGTIWVVARKAALVASLLSTVPAWMRLDPLPILGGEEAEEDDEDMEESEDQAQRDSVEHLFSIEGKSPEQTKEARPQ